MGYMYIYIYTTILVGFGCQKQSWLVLVDSLFFFSQLFRTKADMWATYVVFRISIRPHGHGVDRFNAGFAQEIPLEAHIPG